MKLIILALALLLPIQQKEHTPESKDSAVETTVWQLPASTAITFTGGNTQPSMVINFDGPIVLEINSGDGKRLTVGRDGKVEGDMPHDKAADDFWKNIAKAAPEMCDKK